jgi:hypothetical protein
MEMACWGDHLDVWQAAEDDGYVRAKLDTLEKHNLKAWAISNHLTTATPRACGSEPPKR